MRLARFTVQRPVFTTMGALIVMLLGGVSLLRLPVDLMPDITYPTLSVSTRYENASPEEIEELVTRPIEQALSAVPGVEEITSVSSDGSSNVRVTFAWGTDLDAAANDVRDRLDRVMARLPDDADRPFLRKFDLAAFPILILGASSELDPLSLRRIIDDVVKFRVERIPGVASLDVWGGLEREIHVDLDLDRIRAYGLHLNQVLQRIRAANVDRPAGTLREGNLDLRVRVPGHFSGIGELRDTVIAEREGVGVRIGDIAEVRDAWEKPTRIVRVDGRPGVRLAVSKQSGTHTVAVAKAVLDEIERLNRDVPQIRIVPIIDSSRYIERSIANVGRSALFGGLLAVFVLLFFLRDMRATGVVAVAIPVSVVATFALIHFGGYTLNLMTFGGLALGIGMLVDNAIVVLENVTRLRADGRSPKEAAVEGTAEVGTAIVASTLTTLAVFLPLVFVQGMAGVMFKQLAVVVAFALLCSLAAAVTLVPMLSSRLPALRPLGGAPGRNGTMERMANGYRRWLRAALNHKLRTGLLVLLILLGSVPFARRIGVELMPEADEGEVRVTTEMAVGTHLELVDRQSLRIEDIVRKEVPEIQNMVVTLGGGTWRSTGGHTGHLRIALTPRAHRRRSSEDVAADLRPRLAAVPGVTSRVRAGQGMFVMRLMAGGDERLSVEIRGHDFEAGDALAAQVMEIVTGVAGVTDARISRESGAPERRIQIDRDKAADMELTVQDVAQALEMILGGVSAGQFRDGGDEHRILLRSSQAEWLPLRDLLDLTLVNRAGEAVMLRNLVQVESAAGPVIIERKNRERTTTVSANISGRDMGSIVADVRAGVRNVAVPEGFSIVFGGDYEEQQKAFRELMLSLALALLLVYMVMACQFESLRHPLVVMFSVPLAGVGVVLSLFLTGTTFNVQSFIGCIMLAGIVVNNAILLVDHTNLLRRRDGLPIRQAVEEAAGRRLRPILMTALTTMLALMPLALGIGEGGEAQAPMARTVIGGLFSANAITLFVIPIVYLLIETPRRGEHAS